jgi:type I restriction enzyme S subunit
MAGWQTAKIGDVFRIVNGGTPKTGVASYWGGPHLWITPAEMGGLDSPFISESRRTLSDDGLRVGAELLPENSLILSTRAPIGHLVINAVPMAFNQGCKGLVPPSKHIDIKFAYYFLLANVPLLESLGTGATFKELSSGKLKEVLFCYPTIEEQRRIVAILDEAFEGIATAKANAEKNLQSARELFSSHLSRVFSQTDDLVALADLASDITDGDHMPPPKATSGIPFITISNIVKRTRVIDFDGSFLVPPEYFARLKPNRKPRRGDVLYTVTGATLGIPVLVDSDSDFCFQRHIALIRPRAGVSSEWLSYAMASPQVFAQATSGATGAAQKTVGLNVLRSIKVPRPSEPLQTDVTMLLKQLFSETYKLENLVRTKLAALDELRKSLLHQAFSGQL